MLVIEPYADRRLRKDEFRTRQRPFPSYMSSDPEDQRNPNHRFRHEHAASAGLISSVAQPRAGRPSSTRGRAGGSRGGSPRRRARRSSWRRTSRARWRTCPRSRWRRSTRSSVPADVTADFDQPPGAADTALVAGRGRVRKCSLRAKALARDEIGGAAVCRPFRSSRWAWTGRLLRGREQASRLPRNLGDAPIARLPHAHPSPLITP